MSALARGGSRGIITWYWSYSSTQHEMKAALNSSLAKGGCMSTSVMHARRACDGDSRMNSTDSRCIHSLHSFRVAISVTSHACFRCCWLTVSFMDSAGFSSIFEFSVILSCSSAPAEGSNKKWPRTMHPSCSLREANARRSRAWRSGSRTWDGPCAQCAEPERTNAVRTTHYASRSMKF
jgi:hypothetical protein